MLVGDLVYNDDFDCNCNYIIYDCTEPDVQHWCSNAKILFDTARDGYGKPLDAILDMKVKYITLSNNQLIIEACKR